MSKRTTGKAERVQPATSGSAGIKYPTIRVQLSSMDGNAFFIIGRVREALRRARVPDSEIEQFSNDAMSGDYDHVLQTCMKWVDVG